MKNPLVPWKVKDKICHKWQKGGTNEKNIIGQHLMWSYSQRIGCGNGEKKGEKLYSVANRTHEKAVQFAEKYGIEKVYDNIDQVFEDENVDIIYISTPHNTHIEFLRKALKAGKHVLCEKSITLNSEELEEAINLAKENNVVLAEAMTIYHMPIYKKLNEIISSGKLGDLGLIQMNFGSYKEYDMTNRFLTEILQVGQCLILVYMHFLL